MQEFFTDTITLIAPTNHHWYPRKMIEPEEITTEPLIIREETSGTQRVVLSELAKFDINPADLNIFMELGNAEAIVHSVSDGYGVAFVSNLASTCPIERGRVTSIHVNGMELKRTIYMVRKASSNPHRPRDVFWSFIHAPENEDLIHLAEQ